jgi:hypothetical protein
MYPHVYRVFRLILSIPASQIENERSFIVAGIVTSGRRSLIGVEVMDNIASLHHNMTPEVRASMQG